MSVYIFSFYHIVIISQLSGKPYLSLDNSTSPNLPLALRRSTWSPTRLAPPHEILFLLLLLQQFPHPEHHHRHQATPAHWCSGEWSHCNWEGGCDLSTTLHLFTLTGTYVLRCCTSLLTLFGSLQIVQQIKLQGSRYKYVWCWADQYRLSCFSHFTVLNQFSCLSTAVFCWNFIHQSYRFLNLLLWNWKWCHYNCSNIQIGKTT